MARQGGAAARNAFIGHPESSARISEARSEFNGGGRPGRIGLGGPRTRSGAKKLAMRRINARAVAPSGQDAILGLAHIRNAHREPYSDGHQGYRKSDGSDVGEHAMAKVVRFVPGTFVARQVIGLGRGDFRLSLPALVSLPAQRADRVARPEFEYPMLVIRRNGPLGFHCCQSREILILSSTLVTRLTDNVGMARI